MPSTSHVKSATDHKAAAEERQAAASRHSKGDHAAVLEKYANAKSCCDTAENPSADAHSKSVADAKS